MNQKLKGTPRVQISKPAASGSIKRSIPAPIPSKSKNVPLLVTTRGKSQTIKAKATLKSASVRKHCRYGYLTLLDITMMNRAAPSVSRILPTEELLPNFYHQSFHIARWRKWLRETPQWIVKMGRESLWALTRENDHQTNRAQSNDVVHKYEGTEDLGMKGVKDTNESRGQSIEMKESLTGWRDWSLQLTDRNELLITGKTNQNTVQVSKDVSYCKRIDANTLLHDDGSVYVLNGMPDHFTNLPYYVRNKFQNGFPDDWKAVKCKWIKYVKQGSSRDFSWTEETDERVLDGAVLEDPAQYNTLHQNETVNLPPPRRCDISLHEIPVNCEKTEESHSVAVQDCAKALNSEDKREKEYLKESQSTVIKESRFGRVIIKRTTDLNIKEMLTSVGTDKSSIDSSIVEQGSNTSPGIHFPDTVKNSSDANDNEAAKENIEADIFQNQEIVLERWTPVLVNGCDLKITGYVKSELHTEASHTTEIVKKRKACNSFQTKDGKTYKLMGTFVDLENTVPTQIKRKLAEGLPAQWKMMMKTWSSYASRKQQNII